MPQIDSGFFGSAGNPMVERPGINLNRVATRTFKHLVTEIGESGTQSFGLTVDLCRDCAETFWPVVHGVGGSDYRHQHLSSTDIARRLITPDMLFTSLQREAVTLSSGRIFGYSDQTTRQITFELVAGRHEGGMRSTKSHRDTEALGRADANVGAELTWRGEQRQTKNISCGNDQSAVSVGARGQRTIVMNRTVGIGILNQDTKKPPGPIDRSMISYHHLDS